MANLSAEYRSALKIHDLALAQYHEAVCKYRAREIGDEEYLAARQAREAADRIFDQAFEIESNRI